MTYVTYQAVVVQSLADLYYKTVSYLPNLIIAVIVLVLGWLLAMFLSKIVRKILEALRVDQLANQMGLNNLSEKTGRKLSLAALGAWLVKWFFFLGSFIAAANILNLQEVSTFLYQDVLNYAGHVIVAMAVLLLGMLAASFFGDLVEVTVRASGLHKGESLGAVTRWAIIVFTIIATLAQLQIATAFLQDLFRAIIAMLAIAGGLAFGLGGKEHAKQALDKLQDSLKS